MRRLRRPEPLCLIVFLAGIAMYAVVFISIGSPRLPVVFSFECKFAMTLAGLCAIASLFIVPLDIFVFVHAIRGIAIFCILFMLDGRGGLYELLILMPFTLESGMYMRLPGAAIADGLVLTACFARDIVSISARGGDAFGTIAPLALPAIATSVLSCLVTMYREVHVRDRAAIEELKGVAANLSNSNRAFQDYADSVKSSSRQTERNRITRELHETVGYALTNIIMMMRALVVYIYQNPGKAVELAEKARLQADEALTESRMILYQLRSISAESTRGRMALARLVKSFGEAMAIEATIDFTDSRHTYGAEADDAIFRLVQEGLTNSIWHGKASRVHVTLRKDRDGVEIMIWDNGMGAAEVVEGIGLAGMKERIMILGGSVHARGVPKGFILEAWIPEMTPEVENEG